MLHLREEGSGDFGQVPPSQGTDDRSLDAISVFPPSLVEASCLVPGASKRKND